MSRGEESEVEGRGREGGREVGREGEREDAREETWRAMGGVDAGKGASDWSVLLISSEL